MGQDVGRQLGQGAMQRLRARSVCVVEAGLSDTEFARIEKEFGFEFADDHRAFLAAGVPTNTGLPSPEPGVFYTHPEPWPDWRHSDSRTLREFLDWPIKGVLFDVENNGLWLDGWGSRPTPPKSAAGAARRRLKAVPTMVSVYGHRYLPAGKGRFGHPVLSMWQTDIIVYGLDLANYIDREFGTVDSAQDPHTWNPQVTVDFWRDLI